MRSTRTLLPLVALAALPVAGHAQTTVYSNDFSANGLGFSDTNVSTSNGESFLADSANGTGNGTNILTLTGLAAHSSVTVSFDLYIIQTWDGGGPNGGNSLTSPDAFGLKENTNPVLLTSFANYTNGNTQAYSAATPNGLQDSLGNYYQNAPRSGQFAANHLGYGTADYGDATYRLSYTFADTSSALALAFTSYQDQGVGDEGWGLDNVTVAIKPVPEPASFAALGLGAVAVLRRRKRA